MSCDVLDQSQWRWCVENSTNRLWSESLVAHSVIWPLMRSQSVLWHNTAHQCSCAQDWLIEERPRANISIQSPKLQMILDLYECSSISLCFSLSIFGLVERWIFFFHAANDYFRYRLLCRLFFNSLHISHWWIDNAFQHSTMMRASGGTDCPMTPQHKHAWQMERF